MENAIRVKGSEDNADMPEAPKAIDTPTIIRPPYSRYYGN